jgi:hypothetical protein
MGLAGIRSFFDMFSFLDYLRNDRMATAVAPSQSLCAGRVLGHGPSRPSRWPLHWSQVRAGLDPQRFTMKTADTLLARRTPWQDYCDQGSDSEILGPQCLRLWWYREARSPRRVSSHYHLCAGGQRTHDDVNKCMS